MPDQAPRKLTLEVEAGPVTIEGRVSDEAGASIDFRGWVGLAGALDRFLSGGDGPAATTPKDE